MWHHISKDNTNSNSIMSVFSNTNECQTMFFIIQKGKYNTFLMKETTLLPSCPKEMQYNFTENQNQLSNLCMHSCEMSDVKAGCTVLSMYTYKAPGVSHIPLTLEKSSTLHMQAMDACSVTRLSNNSRPITITIIHISPGSKIHLFVQHVEFMDSLFIFLAFYLSIYSSFTWCASQPATQAIHCHYASWVRRKVQLGKHTHTHYMKEQHYCFLFPVPNQTHTTSSPTPLPPLLVKKLHNAIIILFNILILLHR